MNGKIKEATHEGIPVCPCRKGQMREWSWNRTDLESAKGSKLCDWTWYNMDLAIRRKDLALVKFVAEEDGLDLAVLWLWTTAHAITFEFIELLDYLQKELKVDFAEKIRSLSAEDLQDLNSTVKVAASCGKDEVVKYAVRKFKHRETFNAAFLGAASGGQKYLLSSLRCCGFKIDGELAARAMTASLEHSADVIRLIALVAGDAFVLENNEAGNAALSQAEEVIRTLGGYRKQI